MDITKENAYREMEIYKSKMMAKNICLSCANRGVKTLLDPVWSDAENPDLNPEIYSETKTYYCIADQRFDREASATHVEHIMLDCPFYVEGDSDGWRKYEPRN